MTEIDRSRDRSKYIKIDGMYHPIRVNGTLIRPVMLQQMEEYYDKMKNVWGKTTDKRDEQLCREGNELINEYLRARPRISNRDNVLIGWANTVSSLLDRCRWNECRPKQNITNEPTRMSFQDKVMRRTLGRTWAGRPKNNEWQDEDDVKTVKTSNRRKHQAVYVARESHDGDQNNYCPGQDFSPVSEEEFDSFCGQDEEEDQYLAGRMKEVCDELYNTTLENCRTKKKQTYAE